MTNDIRIIKLNYSIINIIIELTWLFTMHMSTTSHNAGTIIGQIYGVAKKATAIAVRVFDATGKGSSAYVLYY